MFEPLKAIDALNRLAQALTDLHAGLHVGPEQVIPVPMIDQRLLAETPTPREDDRLDT